MKLGTAETYVGKVWGLQRAKQQQQQEPKKIHCWLCTSLSFRIQRERDFFT